MPRFIICADLHIQRDTLDNDKKLLRKITALAQENQCPFVICAGDLIDEKRGVGVEQFRMLYDELERAGKKGVTWIWLRGNHEVGTKSLPEATTYMPLWGKVAYCIIKPEIMTFEDSVFAFLPWYSAHEYVLHAKKMGENMRQYYDKKRVLVSHIGLDEGRASASNMYINQGASLLAIQQQHYDLVLLGDYHHRQTLSDKALYLGIPISREHGDDLDNGVWLMDTALGIFHPIPFQRGEFPQHRTYEVENPMHTVLLGYNTGDVNRIRVPAGHVDMWRQLYPDAQVIGKGTPAMEAVSRLAKVTDKSPRGIWSHFGTQKQLDKDLILVGNRVLDEVTSRSWRES